jgi:hypothetical protein
MTTNVWLDQEWHDELLAWDPKRFGGIERIRKARGSRTAVCNLDYTGLF